MPRYDLRCLSCGHEYEQWVSFEKRDEVTCPKCNSKEKEPVFKATYKSPVIGSGSEGCCSSNSGFT